MFDVKAQTQLADASADMMRACALAVARAVNLSAYQGVSLWSQMLNVPPASPWSAWSRALLVASAAPLADVAGGPSPQAPSDGSAFASYRSSGGHAVAQVIVG